MFVSLICYIIIVINHFVYTPSSRVIYNCFSFVFFRTLYSGIPFFLPIKNGRPVMSARAFSFPANFSPHKREALAMSCDLNEANESARAAGGNNSNKSFL